MGLFSRSSSKSVSKSVKLVREASGSAAISRETLVGSGTRGVSLAKSADAASVSLQKHGLNGIRGRAVFVLDHSGSMRGDYASGAVQELTEKTLAYMLQFASSQTVDVIPFDSSVYPTIPVTLANYHDVVNRDIWKPRMGSTNLADALEVVRNIAKKSDELVYCCILTDGSPDNQPSTTEIVCDLAGYPVFVKFLALRDVPYLQELDDLDDSKRLLDNVDAKFFSDLNAITDASFADAMADEWRSWIDAATTAGVLTN